MQPCLGDHLIIRAGYPLQPGHSLCHLQREMRGPGCHLDGGKKDSEGFPGCNYKLTFLPNEKHPRNAKPINLYRVCKEVNQGLEM